MSFETLGLSKPILQAITEHGYDTPTPIQAQAIPAVLAGKDVMAAAQTGTGKTAGFTLPILERLSQGEKAKSNKTRVLVLTPTRELAAQVNESVETYGKHLSISSTVVFGGVNINPQMLKLRRGVDILVATPGRLLDLYGQNAIRFDELEVLILDEADRMLDMGFIHDIRRILKLLPNKRQNLMFSATFSDEIRALAKTIVNDPIEVSVTPPNSTVEMIEQSLVPVDKKQKTALLVHLIKHYGWDQVLVFSRTKHGANKLATQLSKNDIVAAAIHGNKSQGARTKALADFKNGQVHVLVATDIAARGIDIDLLPYVVNFDLPNVPEDYVHRIGRTGRAGSSGQAISLVSADEFQQLIDIEHLIRKHIPRKEEENFEAEVKLPASKPISDRKPKKLKKPKSPSDGSAEGNSANRGRRNAGRGNGRNSNRKRNTDSDYSEQGNSERNKARGSAGPNSRNSSKSSSRSNSESRSGSGQNRRGKNPRKPNESQSSRWDTTSPYSSQGGGTLWPDGTSGINRTRPKAATANPRKRNSQPKDNRPAGNNAYTNSDGTLIPASSENAGNRKPRSGGHTSGTGQKRSGGRDNSGQNRSGRSNSGQGSGQNRSGGRSGSGQNRSGSRSGNQPGNRSSNR